MAEPAGVLSLLQLCFEMSPKGRAACLDLCLNAGDNAVVGDAGLDPAAAVVGEVEQGWCGAVDRVGEAGLGGIAVLELVPESEEVSGAVGWKKAEDALDGAKLVPFALGPAALDKSHGVADIDLAEVVDEEHFEHVLDIDRLGGEGLEREGEQGKLPRVLGGVLQAVACGLGVGLGCGVAHADFACDGFEAVGFEDEGEDLVERGHGLIVGGRRL